MKILFLPQKIQQLNRKVVFCLRKVLNTILCTTIEQAFKLNNISISKNKAELPEFDTFEDWDEIKDSQGNITNEYSYVVLNITMMNKGNENVEVSLNSLLLHFGTDGGYNEARSFNSSEKKTSKNYFVEKLEPGKKLNVNVAYVAEDKQLNEYKDQLYLMTVLSGNPLGEGTMQVIKSEK